MAGCFENFHIVIRKDDCVNGELVSIEEVQVFKLLLYPIAESMGVYYFWLGLNQWKTSVVDCDLENKKYIRSCHSFKNRFI